MKMNVLPDELNAGPVTVGAAAMRPPITCPAEASVVEAARLMAEHRIGALVLEGRDPRIITERDVVFAVAEEATDRPAASYASDEPVVVDATTGLDAAAEIMVTRGVRHLLIREGDEIVGVFSVRDLVANQVVVAESD